MPVFDSVQQMQGRRRAFRRRTFLSVGLAGVGAYLGYRWWRQRPQALAQRRTLYVTPNGDFYTVSISNRYPIVDPETWRLKIRSSAREREYSLEQIRALPVRQFAKTLSCISNPVGGPAVGNAIWTATPLLSFLEAFDPEPGQRVVFRGLDGFDSSIPIEVALGADVYLAYEMNGAPLPRKHGFPLRVLLPGKYGMKQPRWLTEIELTDDRARGYWERRGWSETADIHPASRIDSARPVSPEEWKVEGVAYAGAAAVRAVEVQVDGGPWQEARITSPAVGDSWTTWEWSWKARPGRYVIGSRVFDVQGNVQEAGFSGTFPNGSTGTHRVIVEVS